MSSEARVVRPYRGSARVQEALASISLEFGDKRLEPGANVSVPKLTFLQDMARVRLAEDETTYTEWAEELRGAVEVAGLQTAHLSLLITLQSSRLKIADIAARVPLDELPHHEVLNLTSGERPRALLAPFGGCDITLYVVLDEELDKVPLRPHRRATWLGKVSWRLRTDLGDIGFVPQELTDEVRALYELPSGTLRHVEVDGATDPERAEEALEVYLDAEVMNQLAAHVNTRGARLFQMELFLDAMKAVVHAASHELQDADGMAYDDGEASLLGRLIARVADENGDVNRDRASLLWNRTRTHPRWVIAHIEDWMSDLSKVVRNAIGEGD